MLTKIKTKSVVVKENFKASYMGMSMSKLMMIRKKGSRLVASALSLGFMFVGIQQAHALDLDQYPRLQKSVAPLVTKGLYTEKELKHLFSTISLRQEVVKKKENAAEKKLTWGGGYREGGYRGIFLQQDRIQQGAQYIKTNQALMDRAKTELGLESEVIAAIIGVETKFGQNKGRHLVFESIATHANNGSKLQFGQLPIFLTLVKKGHLPIDVKGSYSGALGIPQFISSSYRDYGVDFDADERVDLVSNTADAIGSVANYFKRHQWRTGEPVMRKVSPKSAKDAQILDQMLVKKINSRVKPKTTLAAVAPHLQSELSDLPSTTPLSVFKFLDENDQPEYFLGMHNFYVIMRYNHSALYARAVHELSQEISNVN